MGESFAALLEATARRQPQATALVWDGGALTFRDLERRAGGVACTLAARGTRAGDVIALALPNGWPFVAAFLGTLKLGATVVDRLERWVVMEAPTGQRFCVVRVQRPGFPKNANRWD